MNIPFEIRGRQAVKTMIAIAVFMATGCAASLLSAQESSVEFGAELQVYPTGVIPGLAGSYLFDAHSSVHLRLGYNIVRHRDLGEHDDERGGGFGFTLGYRYILGDDGTGWFGGVRTDLWFNEIDWYDDINGSKVEGTTKINVVQPTAIAGYFFQAGDSFFIAPTVSLGVEINTNTRGAEVGQGAILLLGVQGVTRF